MEKAYQVNIFDNPLGYSLYLTFPNRTNK